MVSFIFSLQKKYNFLLYTWVAVVEVLYFAQWEATSIDSLF